MRPTRSSDDDIVALIRKDHARILDQFAALTAARSSPARLAALWTELADILMAHVAAVEEICCLPFLDGAHDKWPAIRELCAHHRDARDAVAEARLHEAGSRLWWLAVRAAHDATRRHLRSFESGSPPEFAPDIPERTRRALASQWQAFMADLSHDRGRKRAEG